MRRMNSIVNAALGSLLLLGVSQAFASTQEMLSACRPFTAASVVNGVVTFPTTHDTGICWGYFTALQAVIVRANEKTGEMLFGVCAPPNSRRSQLIVIFVGYAERRPERRHEPEFDVAMDALRAAFPCR
ncbi:hypothetical protein D3C71_1802880 [compost metagenome]